MSSLHLHHDSDEVAWVLEGEITFLIGDETSVGGPGTCAFFPRDVRHAWKNRGAGTGRVPFLYTPASAGKFIEDVKHRPAGMTVAEREALGRHHRWEILGPNPL